jgi:hypothetical protein
MTTDTKSTETKSFEADVSRLLHLMVHSVYSDRDVFLRELISNAADACEKLRYEAIERPELLGDDPKPRITIRADADNKRLTSRTTASAWPATRWPRRWARSRAPARAPSWKGSRPPRTTPSSSASSASASFGLHGRRPCRRHHAPGRQ